MAARHGVVDVLSLPTLTQLYADGELGVPETVTLPVLKALQTKVQPSATINDKVVYIRGDLTKMKADAIVNAANRSLMGGGGVDGAIHRAAGFELYEACAPLGGCDTGDAKITPGFHLPARHVIHTVGPVYDDGDPQDSDRLLASCYQSSLRLAVASQVRTIAFCAISTGIYGFPSQQAAALAVSTVRAFLEGEQGGKIDRVVFVTFEAKDVDAYLRALPIAFPPVPLPETETEAGADAATESAATGDATGDATNAGATNTGATNADGGPAVATGGGEAAPAPRVPNAPVAGAGDALAADARPDELVIEHEEVVETEAPGEDAKTK
ncbi:hypothetical protein SPBR_03010 [Sporothrix brasiliensis 5110]|uniref:Macro domain-containing protein n=1 Tax=Sporothrix brasiliensis 5110 TaxID=1398154 RepID=A0A0C2J844_9PEZI|nr:uncharacterized protein SPBR_03010 [Sporothrix brasiliensis 5110]KIH93177.1 hypothetical protein SPBR_03010 [Sporothrix brasiliensis 5110]